MHVYVSREIEADGHGQYGGVECRTCSQYLCMHHEYKCAHIHIILVSCVIYTSHVYHCVRVNYTIFFYRCCAEPSHSFIICRRRGTFCTPSNQKRISRAVDPRMLPATDSESAALAETKISAVDGEIKSDETGNRDDLLRLPDHVLATKVLAFFGYKDYTLTARTCQYLKRFWVEAMQHHRMTGTLFVPNDNCRTLREATNRVHEDDRLTTIVLGKGEYQIDGLYLKISSAMNIVGDPEVVKEEIVVLGGIKFKEEIQGTCHLQHLTLRQAKGNGVYGMSSFTMEDVLVEQCRFTGMVAEGTGGVGRCTNVEVCQCGEDGVSASDGASVTLIGAKTAVHHNCTRLWMWEVSKLACKRRTADEQKRMEEICKQILGKQYNVCSLNGLTIMCIERTQVEGCQYGLDVTGSSSSTIQLVFPLTKEQVAIDNGGAGNWGARCGGDINQIKTVHHSSVHSTHRD